MLNYFPTTYGKLTIKQLNTKYTIDIREANCLCAFVHFRKTTKEDWEKYPDSKGKYISTLYSFFNDVQHIKNIMKDNKGKLFWDEVVKITLNLYYKNSWILLTHFTRAGYKVECFYEAPKNETK